mgnify:FL=1
MKGKDIEWLVDLEKLLIYKTQNHHFLSVYECIGTEIKEVDGQFHGGRGISIEKLAELTKRYNFESFEQARDLLVNHIQVKATELIHKATAWETVSNTPKEFEWVVDPKSRTVYQVSLISDGQGMRTVLNQATCRGEDELNTEIIELGLPESFVKACSIHDTLDKAVFFLHDVLEREKCNMRRQMYLWKCDLKIDGKN